MENDCTNTGINLSDFDFIQTADKTKFNKPDPKVFNSFFEYIKSQSITVNRIYYIGDSKNDYLATQDIGIEFLGVKTGHDKGKYFEQNQITALDKLSDIPTLIKS